jgi:hypothetical protein
MLLFGVSDCEKIDRLIVRWPSGIRQTFDDIKPNRELTIIELGTAPFERPPSR